MAQCYLGTILNDHQNGGTVSQCLQATCPSSIFSLIVRALPSLTLSFNGVMMQIFSLLIVAVESKHCLHRVPAPTFILLSDNLLVVLIQNCLGGKQFLTEQDYRFNVASCRSNSETVQLSCSVC